MKKVSSFATFSTSGGGGFASVMMSSKKNWGRPKSKSATTAKTMLMQTQSLQTDRSTSRLVMEEDVVSKCVDDSVVALPGRSTSNVVVVTERTAEAAAEDRLNNNNNKEQRSSFIGKNSLFRSTPRRRGSVNDMSSSVTVTNNQGEEEQSSVTVSSAAPRGTNRRRSSLTSALRRSSLTTGRKTYCEGDVHRERYEKLQGYIKQKKWAKVLKLMADLQENPTWFAEFCIYVSEREEVTREEEKEQEEEGSLTTLLHQVCQYHPPLEVVESLYRINPSALRLQNNPLKQTPLHVAAKYGAHPLVIEFLLEQASQQQQDTEEPLPCPSMSKSLVKQRDVNGKTPLELHLEYTSNVEGTCDPSSFSEEEHEDYRVQQHSSSCHFDQDEDDDRMFTECIPSSANVFRTYGPIDAVVTLLTVPQNAKEEAVTHSFLEPNTIVHHRIDFLEPTTASSSRHSHCLLPVK